ncbi:MAG: hypothetical protein DRO96_03105, partial [Candidatus Aenigmatarchaeota archaeon]
MIMRLSAKSAKTEANKFLLILLVFLPMVGLFGGVVSAATLNVTTTGADSGNCQASPCLTITYA